jgi:hypothetical protein
VAITRLSGRPPGLASLGVLRASTIKA